MEVGGGSGCGGGGIGGSVLVLLTYLHICGNYTCGHYTMTLFQALKILDNTIHDLPFVN